MYLKQPIIHFIKMETKNHINLQTFNKQLTKFISNFIFPIGGDQRITTFDYNGQDLIFGFFNGIVCHYKEDFTIIQRFKGKKNN